MHNILAKAAKIKLLILDVDGVLTEGKLYYGKQGEELKVFHVHDGLGIKLLLASGVEIAVISSRQSEIVILRLQYLGVKHIYQGQDNKLQAYQALLSKLRLSDEQVAYVGDDLPDLPLLQRVGLSITVPNANRYIQQNANWQTQHSGGQGAVREICELIMRAQGTLKPAQEQFAAKGD